MKYPWLMVLNDQINSHFLKICQVLMPLRGKRKECLPEEPNHFETLTLGSGRSELGSHHTQGAMCHHKAQGGGRCVSIPSSVKWEQFAKTRKQNI